MVTAEPLGVEPAAMDEVRALLRIDGGGETPVLADLLVGALARCEAFLGRLAVTREVKETIAARPGWQWLAGEPVSAVLGVGAGGVPLAGGSYESDIGSDGRARVRLLLAPAGPVTVSYRAGLGSGWAALPDGVRRGVARLVAWRFEGAVGPEPAAVAALWQPHRRMRLA